jgi:hypothetical protein
MVAAGLIICERTAQTIADFKGRKMEKTPRNIRGRINAGDAIYAKCVVLGRVRSCLEIAVRSVRN